MDEREAEPEFPSVRANARRPLRYSASHLPGLAGAGHLPGFAQAGSQGTPPFPEDTMPEHPVPALLGEPAPSPFNVVRARGGARLSPVAEDVRRCIQESPGIHFRMLGRSAGLTSAGQLRHHLDRLLRQGLVVEVKDGRFSRFFVPGGHEPSLRPNLARFARPVPRLIAKLLLNQPMGRTELRRRLGCADSTLGYHLQRMLKGGDLVRQAGPDGGVYALSDPPTARRALLLLQDGPEAERARPARAAFVGHAGAGDARPPRPLAQATQAASASASVPAAVPAPAPGRDAPLGEDAA